MTAEEIALLEDRVNRWIRLDAPVKCFFAQPEEIKDIPLRKPPTVSENIRIVQYGDFEYCACGGTHPPRSGMIGQIKILSAMPSKGKVRFSFVCGERAEKRFRECFEALKNTSDLLSCHWAETKDAVSLLQVRIGELTRESEMKNETIAAVEAEKAMRDSVTLPDGRRLAVVFLPFDDRKFLVRFTSARTKNTGMAFFCVLKETEGESFFCFCRPQDVRLDLRSVIQRLNARGGGKEDMVQGTVSTENLRERLKKAVSDQ